MTKKKWALAILSILLLLGYFKFFYKTYSNTVVAKSADCIIALDIKRISNTIIWDIITTPSQWKKVSFSSSGKISWKDMLKIPDYVFVFHSADHPGNAWYSVFEIKSKDDFNKGLAYYHFEKRAGSKGMTEYFSKDLAVEMIQSGNRLLLGNAAVEDKQYIRGVAEELFVKDQYTANQTLLKNIEAKSHLAIQLFKNNFLQEDAVIKANFDKNGIVIDASITAQKQFGFAEHDFSNSPNSLCVLGFTQPPPSLYSLVTVAGREHISKAINFNIDSLLLQSNTCYSLDITGIQPRVDSAISYSYDDNFNPVQKVVLNNVLEPSFHFSIKGDSVNNIYNYWSRNGKLEKTAAGELFIPMPLVRSYCNKITDKELLIASADQGNGKTTDPVNCIFFFKLMLDKIPPALLKYLPADLVKALANIESVQIVAKKDNGQLMLHGNIEKKKNDQLLIDL